MTLYHKSKFIYYKYSNYSTKDLIEDLERIKNEEDYRIKYKIMNDDERRLIDKERKDKNEEKNETMKAKTTILDSQRADIKKKNKMIDIFMGDNISIRMPKFTKEDFFEKKCQQILKFDESSADKRIRLFWDPFPCLKLRQIYNKYTTYFSDFCKSLVSSSYWDNMSLFVIILNSILILISNPKDDQSPNAQSDTTFLFIYTGEMCLKIFAYGLIFVDGAYLRDFWNVMDFFIIGIGLLSYILGKSYFS